MSPEQAQGRVEDVSIRTDVYALGAILYRLLAGRAPYAPRRGDPDPAKTIEWIRRGPPTPLARLAPSAPQELVAICEKAMARQPEARYASVDGELARELDEFLESRVTGKRRRGTLDRGEGEAPRERIAAVMIVLPALDDADPAEVGLYAGADGRELSYRVVRAASERHRLLYLHGIESHGGWFLPAARGLAERGCTTYLVDRRGSGLNRSTKPGGRRVGRGAARGTCAASASTRSSSRSSWPVSPGEGSSPSPPRSTVRRESAAPCS